MLKKIFVLLIFVVNFCLTMHAVDAKGINVKKAPATLNYTEFYKTKYDLKDKLYIIGHKNPDSDTVCSAISYAELKNKMGLKAEPIVCGAINDETAFALEYFGITPPTKVDNVKGLNIILVDHASFQQAANGMNKANVLEIVDHHQEGNIIPEKPISIRCLPVGSVNTIIYGMYGENRIVPSPKAAGAMLTGILSDTMNLRQNASVLDKKAVAELSVRAKVKDVDAFYSQMAEAAASYKGKTDKEIFDVDSKNYEFNGRKVAISCILAKSEEAIPEVAQRVNAVLPVVLSERNADMVFARVAFVGGNKSAVIYCGKDSKAVAENAYGMTKDNMIIVNEIVGRKDNLVPKLSKEINKL